MDASEYKFEPKEDDFVDLKRFTPSPLKTVHSRNYFSNSVSAMIPSPQNQEIQLVRHMKKLSHDENIKLPELFDKNIQCELNEVEEMDSFQSTIELTRHQQIEMMANCQESFASRVHNTTGPVKQFLNAPQIPEDFYVAKAGMYLRRNSPESRDLPPPYESK